VIQNYYNIFLLYINNIYIMSGFFNEIVNIYNINPPQQAEETPDYKKYKNIDYKSNEMGLKDIDDENNLHLYLYNNNGIKQNTGINMSIDNDTNNHEINFIINGDKKLTIDKNFGQDKIYSYGLMPSSISTETLEAWIDTSIIENVIIDNRGIVQQLLPRNVSPTQKITFTNNEKLGITYDYIDKMVVFNASDETHLRSSTLSNYFSGQTAPYTITIVSSPKLLSQTSTFSLTLFSFINTTSVALRSNIFYTLSSSLVYFIGCMQGSSYSLSHHISTFERFNERKFIISVVVNSDNTTLLYINGLFVSVGNHQLERPNILAIGRDATVSNSNYFNGKFGELILQREALTLSKILDLHNYLNNKWNVYERSTVDIFCIAGQSNARGTGLTTGGTSEYGKYVDPEYFFTPTANIPETPFFEVSDNIRLKNVRFKGATTNILVAEQDNPSIGSAYPSFCREYYEKTGREAIIISSAIGGTSLLNANEWDPSNYQNNIARKPIEILPLLINKLKKYGYTINKKNILWCQGESDVSGGATQQQYYDKFLQLHDLYINIGGYDNFFYVSIADNNYPSLNSDNIINAQRILQIARPNTLFLVFDNRMFTTFGSGLLQSDNVHYQQQGYNIMGKESAKRIKDIIYGNSNTQLNNLLIGNNLKVMGETIFNNTIKTNDDIIINPKRSVEHSDIELKRIFNIVSVNNPSGVVGSINSVAYIYSNNSYIGVSEYGLNTADTGDPALTRRFYYSFDGFVWTTSTESIIDNNNPPIANYSLGGVSFGLNILVAVFTTGNTHNTNFRRFIYSENYGLTWTSTGSTTSPTVYNNVKFINNIFIALSLKTIGNPAPSNTPRISHSADGITWTEDVVIDSSITGFQVRDINYISNTYYITLTNTSTNAFRVYTSTNLSTFTMLVVSGISQAENIVYSPLNNLSIITSNTRVILYSYNLSVWSSVNLKGPGNVDLPTNIRPSEMQWIESLKLFVFVANSTVASDYAYYWSRDGFIWNKSNTVASGIRRFVYGNNQFVACSERGGNEFFNTEKFERNVIKNNMTINNNLIINSRFRQNVQTFIKGHINISEITTPIVILNTTDNDINIYLSGVSFNEFLGLRILFIKTSSANNINFMGPIEQTVLVTPSNVIVPFNNTSTHTINTTNTGSFELTRIINNSSGGMWTISK